MVIHPPTYHDPNIPKKLEAQPPYDKIDSKIEISYCNIV